jgi:hypothetical protein
LKILLVLLWCAEVGAGQQWSVRTVSVVPTKGRVDEGTKAKLRIDANTLLCEAKKAPLCGIPLSAITGLSHDHLWRNRAAEYGDRTGTTSACYGYSCGADLVMMGALAPFRIHWEYATIYWHSDGTPRITVLRFRKSDFPSFERQLSTRTGLKFEDAAAQRAAALREIERRNRDALPLRFDQAVFIRNELMPRGLYQILVVEREPAAGQLYFFRGKKVVSNRPALVVPVSILVDTSNALSAEPEYSARGRWNALHGIRLPGRTVRITP